MRETLNKIWQAQLAMAIFFLLTAWWLILLINRSPATTIADQQFSATYGIIALFGGICGIYISKQWGGLKSIFGRAMLMFSFGLLAQEFGQLVYSYFFYNKIEMPYPSIGDLGYFSSILFYIYGVYLLARASGVRFTLKTIESRLQAIIIPLLILIICYWLFLKDYQVDWSQPLRVFLDFAYPLGDAVYISLALLTYFLTRNFLGGLMRNRVLFLLLALVVQFIADYTFLYQSRTSATAYPGGVNDYLYLFAYFLMTFGLLQMEIVLVRLRRLSS
jgi:hypothetical protein